MSRRSVLLGALGLAGGAVLSACGTTNVRPIEGTGAVGVQTPVPMPTSTITPLPRYAPSSAPTATLTMRAGAFSPTILAVAPGTVIRVVNADGEVHSLMPAEFADHQMRSSDVGPGNSVHMTAPDTPGEYKYTCLYHSWVASESGTIMVTTDAASADALNQSNGVDSNADPGVIAPPTSSATPGATSTPGAGSTPTATSTSSSGEDEY